MVGWVTQCAPSGSCHWRGPGLPPDAPLVLYKEEAASCRFTNVQSPIVSTRLIAPVITGNVSQVQVAFQTCKFPLIEVLFKTDLINKVRPGTCHP
jgi:hypothetical protein